MTPEVLEAAKDLLAEVDLLEGQICDDPGCDCGSHLLEDDSVFQAAAALEDAILTHERQQIAKGGA